MAQYSRLSFAERCRIEQLKKQGQGVRSISKALCRSPSTICRELKRRFTEYNAKTAQKDSIEKSCQRVKKRKISGPLAEMILYLLIELHCSPEQISGYLRKRYDFYPEMQVSSEAIYLWIYRHESRKVITQFLRKKHKYRRARKSKGVYRGGIKNRVSIRQRPKEVEDREEIGHWEGDLIIGEYGRSAVGTLVERSTRYTILVQLDSQDSEAVVAKFISSLRRIPPHLRRSLTYDNGSEMAYHEKITREIETKVYFANPRSPWQRGTNENTNGLIREFFPKSTDLSVHSREKIGGIASLLNRRPRKVLNFNSPEQAFEYCWENESAKLSQCLASL